MERKITRLLGIALLGATLYSCSSESDSGNPDNGNTPALITTRLSFYDETDHALNGENQINDMKACVFENGKMTHIYEDIQKEGDSYNLLLDRYAGNLYMVANSEGLLDLQALKGQQITEDEWKKMAISAKDGQLANFFTGTLSLNPSQGSGSSHQMNLRRGLARFDLVVKAAGEAQVKSVKLSNSAQSAFLFPQGASAASPENTERKDDIATFNTPLKESTQGVLYVYEQSLANQEISVEVSFDGGPVRTITKPLANELKRNTIYTITVRKDDITISVGVNLEDWETGEDTEIVPTHI